MLRICGRKTVHYNMLLLRPSCWALMILIGLLVVALPPQVFGQNTSVKRSARKTTLKTKVKKSTPKKKAVDYVAPGLAAFQKQNYTEALRLFDIATTKDVKNPLAWFNRARAVIALNIAKEPDDYCNFEQNWILDALASLSKAADLGSAKVLPLLKSTSDGGFKQFRDRPEYKKWILVHSLPLKTDIATQDFFAKHNDWLIANPPLPSTVVTFVPTHQFVIATSDGLRETGTWSAGADRVVVKMKNDLKTLNLGTASFAFAQGAKSYKIVALKDPTNSKSWTLGPEIADCPQP